MLSQKTIKQLDAHLLRVFPIIKGKKPATVKKLLEKIDQYQEEEKKLLNHRDNIERAYRDDIAKNADIYRQARAAYMETGKYSKTYLDFKEKKERYENDLSLIADSLTACAASIEELKRVYLSIAADFIEPFIERLASNKAVSDIVELINQKAADMLGLKKLMLYMRGLSLWIKYEPGQGKAACINLGQQYHYINNCFPSDGTEPARLFTAADIAQLREAKDKAEKAAARAYASYCELAERKGIKATHYTALKAVGFSLASLKELAIESR